MLKHGRFCRGCICIDGQELEVVSSMEAVGGLRHLDVGIPAPDENIEGKGTRIGIGIVRVLFATTTD